MRPQDVFSYLFDVGKDIVGTVFGPTGVVTVQTADTTTETPDASGCELWQQSGFTSRPALPSVGAASCQALVLKHSDRDIIFATRDVRGTSILANLADGETCVYASGAQGRTTYKEDGSVVTLTTDSNAPDGNACFTSVTPTEFRAFSPNVGYVGDAKGWQFSTWHGARFVMSGLGLPAPFNALGLNSLIALKADVITLDAAVLNLGRVGGAGIAQPVVQAAPFAVIAGLLKAVVDAEQTYLDAIAAVPAAVGVAPIVTPAVLAAQTALTTARGALDTALTNAGNASSNGGTATNTSIA